MKGFGSQRDVAGNVWGSRRQFPALKMKGWEWWLDECVAMAEVSHGGSGAAGRDGVMPEFSMCQKTLCDRIKKKCELVVAIALLCGQRLRSEALCDARSFEVNSMLGMYVSGVRLDLPE